MKKNFISLLVGLVLGTIFTHHGLKWLSQLVIQKWTIILAVILILALLLWLIYINIDTITKKLLNIAVPEYHELVENLFTIVETFGDDNRRDELLENARQFSKRTIAKYLEINSRRMLLNFMIGFLIISLGILNLTLLSNQNEIMTKQATTEEVNHKVSKLESIQASLKDVGPQNRTANNMLHDFFNYHNEILDLEEKHEHILVDYYIDLENMKIHNQNITNLNFSTLYLNNLDARSVYFTNIDFSYTGLDGAYFEDCTFKNCTFDSMWFNKIDFIFCDFDSSSFKNVDYNSKVNANFLGSTFKNSKPNSEEMIKLAKEGNALFNFEECDKFLNSLQIKLDSLDKNTYHYDSLYYIKKGIESQRSDFIEK